ncbi:hypothetical protein [Corallococcus carmarthensis]|nr:hypothetical protein [Corallococcus carmarthensis]
MVGMNKNITKRIKTSSIRRTAAWLSLLYAVINLLLLLPAVLSLLAAFF